jgi:hypothetical protein
MAKIEISAQPKKIIWLSKINLGGSEMMAYQCAKARVMENGGGVATWRKYQWRIII